MRVRRQQRVMSKMNIYQENMPEWRNNELWRLMFVIVTSCLTSGVWRRVRGWSFIYETPDNGQGALSQLQPLVQLPSILNSAAVCRSGGLVPTSNFQLGKIYLSKRKKMQLLRTPRKSWRCFFAASWYPTDLKCVLKKSEMLAKIYWLALG